MENEKLCKIYYGEGENDYIRRYLKEGLNYYIEDVKRFGGINYEIYF